MRVRLERRIVSWFSCGAASAIATKLAIKKYKNVIPVYCDTNAEHKDNKRFLKDCEEWFDRKITILKSTEYVDTWDVWEKRKYLSGVNGAPCTSELKMIPRLSFQKPDDLHIFGYTNDSNDRRRAKRLKDNFFELDIETPLIDERITKEGCLALVRGAKIKIPVGYELGFPNNNCIPCVKSESPAYWSMIRKYFKVEFDRMVELSRRLNVRLVVLKGERKFIDEIPEDFPAVKPLVPRCDFMCGMLDVD